MKKNLTFLLTFCFAKGTVFLIPIILADILTSKDFGILEYALAGVGMLINAIINLGVPGAYPYFILKKKELKIKEGFILHPVWLAFIFLGNQVFYYSTELYEPEIYMALNISFIIANQMFYSIQLKSHVRIHFSVLMDAGIYILLASLTLAYYLKIITLTISQINLAILLYASLYFVLAIIRLIQTEKENIFIKYKKIIQFSIHLLISSVLLFALTVSGRVLAKHFFGYEEAGLYGFYYRLSAIVVMIYQVVSIRFFKDLYTVDHHKLDRYFSLFFGFIFALSIGVYFIAPYVVPYFSNYFVETIELNKMLFFIVLSQMTMWIATALNSSIIDREKLAKVNNLRLALVLLMGLIVLYYFQDDMSLEKMSFIIYTFFFLAVLTQYFSLSLKKISFKRSIITVVLVYLSSLIYIFVL